MATVLVKAAKGRLVRDLERKPLPSVDDADPGVQVDDADPIWWRRIKDGDVVVVKAESAPAPTVAETPVEQE
jgi:hypothetical protein